MIAGLIQGLNGTATRLRAPKSSSRGGELGRARAHFLRPLPPIPTPLAPPDPDITLSLQPLVERVYARSYYDRDIDYRQPLHPPLNPAEAAWLEERRPAARNGLQ